MPLLQVVLILMVVVLLITAVILLILMLKRQRRPAGEDQLLRSIESIKAELISKQMEGLISLRESLDTTGRLVNDRLAEGSSSIDNRLKVFGEIEQKLGQLEQQTQSLEKIGQNIQSLSELLKPPKVRGILGEMLLENLLNDILPDSMFATQYQFPDGSRVDVIIRMGKKILPIDSKFPLESYQRLVKENNPQNQKDFNTAIKKQIDTINKKYLRPDLNTTDFVLLYIPSEAVYYQFIAGKEKDLFEYALSKKVIPSSPGHLYAFLVSMSAVFAEISLTADPSKLTGIISNIADSLERLKQLHQRMEGSGRSISTCLSKVKEELDLTSTHLDKLLLPKTEQTKPVITEQVSVNFDSDNGLSSI